MSESHARDPTRRLLDDYPRLRGIMRQSPEFEALKKRQRIVIDGEPRYIVMGDAIGDEEQLFMDALARGAAGRAQDELERHLFGQLGDTLQSVVATRLGVARGEGSSSER